MNNTKLSEAVINLHEIARVVEQEIGTCKTSIEIRRAADALHVLSKEFKDGHNI
jgi:hypothetical protein